MINLSGFISNKLYNHSLPTIAKPKQAKSNAIPASQLAPCPRPSFLSFGDIDYDSCPNYYLTWLLSEYAFEAPSDISKASDQFTSGGFKGIAGDVPAEWNLNDQQKKQLFKLLGAFADETRTIYYQHNLIGTGNTRFYQETMGRFKSYTDAACESLLRKLQEMKIINNAKFEAKINGGEGFVLLIDKKYALKVFYNFNSTEDIHGHLIEPNRALFLKKLYADLKAPRRMVDMYFADLEAGYMFSEHKDATLARFGQQSATKNSLINDITTKSGLVYMDSGTEGNIVDGILIDYGGFKVTDECRDLEFVYPESEFAYT